MKDRKPNRLQGYDYSQDNLYFVTSCVQDRVCCFGKIFNQQMILNEYGKITEQQWNWLGTQYPYVQLHAFIVMPNHIHGIIEINRGQVGTGRDLSLPDPDLSLHDPDLSLLSLHDLPKIKSLSELMGAFKTTSSKQIHLSGYLDFKWQRSFHDHIIRNQEAYDNISNYIITNPMRWEDDTFYT